jgi:hypothetical protein
MPPSKNPKWYFLNYNESVRFKLMQVGSELDHNGKLVRFLAKATFTHIRNYPFSNGRKTMPCAGERCEACMGGHVPTKVFPVHIMVGDKEYVMDMTATAHSAVTEVIDDIVTHGGTEDDILQTEFQLARLNPREKPYYVCVAVQSDEPLSPEELKVSEISESDINTLRKLSEKMRDKPPKNPRGSIIITLKQKYEWPDIKINAAFEKYLDDYGYFKGD